MPNEFSANLFLRNYMKQLGTIQRMSTEQGSKHVCALLNRTSVLSSLVFLFLHSLFFISLSLLPVSPSTLMFPLSSLLILLLLNRTGDRLSFLYFANGRQSSFLHFRRGSNSTFSVFDRGTISLSDTRTQ